MIKMINMTPTHQVDSPLRRSGIGALRKTISTPINDDELERQESRDQSEFLNSTSVDTIADKEGLQYCLKIFNENKINKDNAWAMSLIDNLSSLISNHHKSLRSFQMVGTTLEASSKIYGLRVDSVHTDVLRMSSGLTNTHQAQNENDTDNAEDDQSSGNDPNESNRNPAATAKKKKTRKPRSTISKSKETIHAKLDTVPFTDSLFAKLNSDIGDINSSDRLMQNALESIDSKLMLRMDYPFWDCSESGPIDFTPNYNNNNENSSLVQLAFKLQTQFSDLIRPQHSGYKILNTPAEDDSCSKDDSSPPIEKSLDESQLEVAFDMDADIEPITDVNYIDVDLDSADLVELTADDQNALNACKGLRRKPVVLNDMRPLDSSSTHLEYSYRPLDNISQFWAGPSHWKFRRSRVSRMPSSIATHQTKKKAKRSIEPIELNCTIDDGVLFLRTKQKTSQKIKQVNLYKRWDTKQLKLPTNMQLDRNRFGEYPFAPAIAIARSEPSSSPNIEPSGYNYENANDKEYCDNLGSEHDADDMDRSATSISENVCPNIQNESTQNDEAVVEIGTVYEGAPQMVERIYVPFAKKAKVVDMKTLKRSCFTVIDTICHDTVHLRKIELPQTNDVLNDKYHLGGASFNEVYKKLPTSLTKSLQEVLSPSVAFYAILHLANENNLRLMPVSNRDFMIRKIDSDNNK